MTKANKSKKILLPILLTIIVIGGISGILFYEKQEPEMQEFTAPANHLKLDKEEKEGLKKKKKIDSPNKVKKGQSKIK